MIKTFSTCGKILAASTFAGSLLGFGAFAGVAAADPETCWGGVPGLGAHMPAYPEHRVPGAQDADCATWHDVSDTSMNDIGQVGTWGMDDIAGAGSYPGHSPAFTWTPQ